MRTLLPKSTHRERERELDVSSVSDLLNCLPSIDHSILVPGDRKTPSLSSCHTRSRSSRHLKEEKRPIARLLLFLSSLSLLFLFVFSFCLCFFAVASCIDAEGHEELLDCNCTLARIVGMPPEAYFQGFLPLRSASCLLLLHTYA